MAIIYVRSIIEYQVDTEAYVRAAIEADYITPDEIDPTNPDDVADRVVNHEEETLIDRWARDSVQLTDTKTIIQDTPFS